MATAGLAPHKASPKKPAHKPVNVNLVVAIVAIIALLGAMAAVTAAAGAAAYWRWGNNPTPQNATVGDQNPQPISDDNQVVAPNNDAGIIQSANTVTNKGMTLSYTVAPPTIHGTQIVRMTVMGRLKEGEKIVLVLTNGSRKELARSSLSHEDMVTGTSPTRMGCISQKGGPFRITLFNAKDGSVIIGPQEVKSQ